MRRVLSGWPPMPVTFRAVRSHANEFVFLMASRGADSLVALHDKLYTRSLRLPLRPDIAFEPHITIAWNKDPAALEAIHGEAVEAFSGEFADVMRAASLLAVHPDGKIEVLGNFPLHSR